MKRGWYIAIGILLVIVLVFPTLILFSSLGADDDGVSSQGFWILASLCSISLLLNGGYFVFSGIKKIKETNFLKVAFFLSLSVFLFLFLFFLSGDFFLYLSFIVAFASFALVLVHIFKKKK